MTAAPDQDMSGSLPEFPGVRAAACPFDPPPALQALRQDAPLTRARLRDGGTVWLVTGYAEQKAVLSHPQVSSDVTRPGYPLPVLAPNRPDSAISFVFMDDPEHHRLRRMVQGAFTVKRVETMRPAVQRIVDRLIDDLLAGPRPVDLVEAFALPVPSLVICELLGVPYADHGFFQDNSQIIVKRDVSVEDRTAAGGRLRQYLDGLVGDKLVRPGDDLLSQVAARVTAGELTRQEAAQMGVLLLVAGHETTANMIALGTLALLRHPGQLALLRGSDDPALIAGAVEELLRYLNITHGGRRRVAKEDIEIGGQVIRAGEGIIVANDIGNRDPGIFPAPDELDVRRDARRHVAFGFGVHQCLGQPLARLELQVAYGTLYRRIPTLALAAEFEKIPFKHDGQVYGVYELPVTW